jgi:hypothetical protein
VTQTGQRTVRIGESSHDPRGCNTISLSDEPSPKAGNR